MGEMNKTAVIELLKKQNPKAKLAEIAMYADAYMDYMAAQRNIDAHGSIVFHPRTGAPIDNPYLRVREKSGATMRSLKFIKADAVWALNPEGDNP